MTLVCISFCKHISSSEWKCFQISVSCHVHLASPPFCATWSGGAAWKGWKYILPFPSSPGLLKSICGVNRTSELIPNLKILLSVIEDRRKEMYDLRGPLKSLTGHNNYRIVLEEIRKQYLFFPPLSMQTATSILEKVHSSSFPLLSLTEVVLRCLKSPDANLNWTVVSCYQKGCWKLTCCGFWYSSWPTIQALPANAPRNLVTMVIMSIILHLLMLLVELMSKVYYLRDTCLSIIFFKVMLLC